MYLKRIFNREPCACLKDKEPDPQCEKCNGRGFIPTTLKGVKVLRISKLEHETPNWVEGGAAEGWLTISKGQMIVTDVDGKDYVTQIASQPAIYCCHCDERLGGCGDGATPEGAARMLKHVTDNHAGNKSPDPNNPAGYRQDNFYAIVSDKAIVNMTREEAQAFDKQMREAAVKKIGEKHLKKTGGVKTAVSVAALLILGLLVNALVALLATPVDTVLAANFIFNFGLGRFVEWYIRIDTNDPAASAFIIVVLATAGIESDAVLKDKDTLADVVSGTTNEVTNTNYARKVLTDADLSAFAPDDTNDRADLDIPDQTWTAVAAGDGFNDFLVCYDSDTAAGTDANIVPGSQHDFVVVPDGSDVTAQIAAAGFFRAS